MISLNAEAPLLAEEWTEVADSEGWLHTGTAWSWLSAPGDLLCTPRSRLEPTSQGWTRTSSVVILSLGSFLSRHLIRHFARELRFSGRVNWPRLIFAKRPLCSAPWNGYLQWRIVMIGPALTLSVISLTFQQASCRASPPDPTCRPPCPSTECWTSGSLGRRRLGTRACQREGRQRSPQEQRRLPKTPV